MSVCVYIYMYMNTHAYCWFLNGFLQALYKGLTGLGFSDFSVRVYLEIQTLLGLGVKLGPRRKGRGLAA